MNERLPEHRYRSTREESHDVRAELDELALRGAELARGVEAVLRVEPLDVDGFVRLVASRCLIADKRVALLTNWMARLDGRLSRVESRLAALSREVLGHEEALKMVCEVLKELDDPYGFGLSLDEQIGRGSSECIPSEPED